MKKKLTWYYINGAYKLYVYFKLIASWNLEILKYFLNLLIVEYKAKMLARMFYYNYLIRLMMSFTTVTNSEIIFIIKIF